MGKIFGISNLPVSTIESTIKPVSDEIPKVYPKIVKKVTNQSDKFVSINKTPEPNAFVKMRNGFGKLMSHFSHPKTNV